MSNEMRQRLRLAFAELTVLAFAFMASFAPFAQMASATDWFVATNGTGDGTNNWANATNSLQGAIDASSVADIVWVSNGVYETGGRTNYPDGGLLTNRVVIDKAIIVRSANNDPTNTVIKGAWDANTNGPAAVRCVYMAANSSLIGFMLTNGATLAAGNSKDQNGGAVYSPDIITTTISNCIITGNSAKTYGGGAYYGALFNCILIGNSSYDKGGGAAYSMPSNCTFVGNLAYGAAGALSFANNGAYGCAFISNWTASAGGGTRYCSFLTNCTFIGNSAGDVGGGAGGDTLYNCTFIGNLATNFGGGAAGSYLKNCTLTGNSAGNSGGGASGSSLYNCLVVSNRSSMGGGVSEDSYMFNCTIVSNSATSSGGGTRYGKFANCIVYFNTAPADSNWTGTSYFTNSCTTPLPTGVDNITNDPQMVNFAGGNYRLTANSPCVNTGTNQDWMTNSVDLDNRQRIRYGTVDMGAYEMIYKVTIYRVQ